MDYPGGFITKTAPTLNPALGNAAPGVWRLNDVLKNIKAGTWPSYDPYFENTTLLLHGNGTNGGQNNTFQDSSSNNFTITRNGNTTQGTFSPFSQTGWSNYFDGTNAYLYIADGSWITLGANDFTAECWIYNTSSTGASQYICGQGNSSGQASSVSFELYLTSSRTLQGGIYVGSQKYATSSGAIPLNQWTHVALVRDGGNVRIYINGVQDGVNTTAGTSSVTDQSYQFSIGRGGEYNGLYFPGYISNFRFVNGTCLYPNGTTFTPSTTPLTAVTNTKLLTSQSNRFIDNSASPLTITPGNAPSVQAFSPFAPTAAYSASTVGGSGYFDGTGDYLSVANNTALQLGSSDWDIECWVYLTTTISGAQRIISQADSNYEFAYYLSNMALTAYSFQSGGTQNFAISMGTLTTGQWYHLATTRSGSNIRSFINGTQVGTATFSGTIDARTGGWNFGASYAPSEYLNGYISSARIVKGSAVYTSAFTPPTAPLTNITNTSLLLNFTNAAIIDNTAKNVLETVGNAQISTTQSKFGGASLYFDGSGDYLVGRTTDLLSFNTGDFTVEMWVYPNSVAGNIVLIDTRSSGTDSGWAFYINSSSKLALFTSNADRITAGSALSASTWTHVVLARSGSTLAIYMNGVQSATATYSTTMTCPGRISIASGFDNAAPLNGYIDDLRITKGYARYTANFTPQTSQWQDQ